MSSKYTISAPKDKTGTVIGRTFECMVIGVSETWLGNTVNDREVTVPGHIVVRNDKNRGEGTCLYGRLAIVL